MFILLLQPTAESPVPQPKTETSPNYPVYIGLYNYSASAEVDDMSFMKGDLMYVLSNNDGDWWYARLKDGEEEGYVPSNYVTEYRSGLYAEK
jgi:hypothetical protein